MYQRCFGNPPPLTRTLEEDIFESSQLNLVDVVVWDNEKALLVAALLIRGATSRSSLWCIIRASVPSRQRRFQCLCAQGHCYSGFLKHCAEPDNLLGLTSVWTPLPTSQAHAKPRFAVLPADLCGGGPDETPLWASPGHLPANWVLGKWMYLLETLNATVRSANGKSLAGDPFTNL